MVANYLVHVLNLPRGSKVSIIKERKCSKKEEGIREREKKREEKEKKRLKEGKICILGPTQSKWVIVDMGVLLKF